MMTEPPRPPTVSTSLVFPPRRLAAIVLLAALPLASVCGAFRAREQSRAAHAGMSIEAHYPARTLRGEHEQLDLTVAVETSCERAVLQGLSGYLASFEDVRTVPPPASAHLLYQGPVAPGQRLLVQVQARPSRAGPARATLSLHCDRQPGPSLDLTTFVFP